VHNAQVTVTKISGTDCKKLNNTLIARKKVLPQHLQKFTFGDRLNWQ